MNINNADRVYLSVLTCAWSGMHENIRGPLAETGLPLPQWRTEDHIQGIQTWKNTPLLSEPLRWHGSQSLMNMKDT